MVYISTDGSFAHKPERCGFGVHVEMDGKGLFDLSGFTTDEKYLKAWNVSSELIAAILGVSWSISNGHKDITLYYDYSGVENFVVGTFKARSEIAKMYVMIMAFLRNSLGANVNFVKVKGHSGHAGNEAADALAGRYEKDKTSEVGEMLDYLFNLATGQIAL